MDLNIVKVAKGFLKDYLRDKTVDYETVHPWRKDAKFIIMHSLRVHNIAVKILKEEKTKLSQEDILLVEVAAVLHDIGKTTSREGHAYQSGKIVRQWLLNNKEIAGKIGNTERLIKIIEGHSNKEEKDTDICLSILKDADILDEIGALSIFMATNRLNRHSPFFFHEMLDRLDHYELDYCHRHMELLQREYSKELLSQKIYFIEGFIKQLKLELEGTEELITY